MKRGLAWAWAASPPQMQAQSSCFLLPPLHSASSSGSQLDQMSQADRKAAAEARRAKVLARGGDRLARITGSLAEPDAAPGPPTASQQPAAGVSSRTQAPDATPPSAAAPAAAAAANAPAATSTPPLPAPAPTSSGSELAASLAADVRKTASQQSLPDAHQSQQQQQAARLKGTAVNGKWAQYAAQGPAQQRRRQRDVSTGETLHAAVQSTGRLRLVVAALLAVLLAAHWDAAALAGTAARSSTLAAMQPLSQQRAQQQQQAGGSGGWAAELAGRWQGAVGRARQTLFGPAGKEEAKLTPAPAKAAFEAGGWAAAMKQQLAAAAASPVGQRASAAAQAVGRQWEALAASPAGKQVAGSLAAGRQQLAGVAASPAGQQVGDALQAGQAQLAAGSAWSQAQLAAAAASPAGRAAQQALARLPPLSSLPSAFGKRLAAAASLPAVQSALAAIDGVPPLAALLALNLSLIGAAAAAMAAAPGLVHSTLELDLQAPTLLQRLASIVPGLLGRLSLAAAAARLLAGLLDDAAAFVVALLAYYQLPVLLGEASAA